MAKYECNLQGDFDDFLQFLGNEILKESVSATCEDGSDYTINGVRCAVRIYERYSMIGSNRVSLSVTLIGSDEELFVSAIASGGSQAVFFKINTIGEQNFLQQAIDIIGKYKAGGQ